MLAGGDQAADSLYRPGDFILIPDALTECGGPPPHFRVAHRHLDSRRRWRADWRVLAETRRRWTTLGSGDVLDPYSRSCRLPTGAARQARHVIQGTACS